MLRTGNHPLTRIRSRRLSMIVTLLGMVLPWLLIAIGGWLGFQLVLQNGRILLRLETIESHLGSRGEPRPAERRKVGGLAVGTAAPDFELPDLMGVRRKLS